MSVAQVQWQRDGLFQVSGDLSFDTVPEVWRQSQGLFRDHPHLEIDLHGVLRVDSSAVALLLEWLADARRDRQSIAYLNPPAALLDIARVSSACQLLPLRPQDGH